MSGTGKTRQRDQTRKWSNHPWIEATIVEAQAAERERCAEAVAGFCRSSERKIRSLSPDPNYADPLPGGEVRPK
jgi:hypothetical protein